MIRVVRLTIETNALTGTFAPTQPIWMSISPVLPPLSRRGYYLFPTRHRLPRMFQTDPSHLTSSDISPSTQQDIYFVLVYVLSLALLTAAYMSKKGRDHR